METQAKAVVELKTGQKIILSSELFENDEEINVDNLLKIDIAHLPAEITTFPIIMNQLGILLAEVNNQLSEKKLDFEIFCAKRKETIRKNALTAQEELDEDEETGKIKKKIRAPKKLTIDEVEDALSSDPIYKVKKTKVFELQKQVDYVNSLFWSAKSKDEKLNKLSLTLKEGDVYDGLVNTTLQRINYVSIRKVQPKL